MSFNFNEFRSLAESNGGTEEYSAHSPFGDMGIYIYHGLKGNISLGYNSNDDSVSVECGSERVYFSMKTHTLADVARLVVELRDSTSKQYTAIKKSSVEYPEIFYTDEVDKLNTQLRIKDTQIENLKIKAGILSGFFTQLEDIILEQNPGMTLKFDKGKFFLSPL